MIVSLLLLIGIPAAVLVVLLVPEEIRPAHPFTKWGVVLLLASLVFVLRHATAWLAIAVLIGILALALRDQLLGYVLGIPLASFFASASWELVPLLFGVYVLGIRLANNSSPIRISSMGIIPGIGLSILLFFV